MNPVLWVLPGAVVGAAEFFLTKAISTRVLQGKTPILLLCGKLASYAAILLTIFFLLPRDGATWLGIGAGGGVLIVGLVFAFAALVKEKR